MLTMWRAGLLVMILALAASPLFAGGRGEPSSAPGRDNASQSAPEGSPPETGSAGSGQSTSEPTAMDEATTEVLFELGLMPFQKRIPSENFVLENLSGAQVALEDYRGKVVFLNFWATWCPPCREEMPSMQALYEELSAEGLEILAVNVLEPRDLVAGFIEEYGFTYPVLLDRNGRVQLRYSVRAYPTTYIIDRAGYVIAVRPGYHDWSTPEMISGFRTLLAQ